MLNSIETMPRLAALYLRCSTDMQDGSIEQQRKELEQYAAKNGYTIVREFVDEAQSGVTFLDRPAFNEMVSSVENRLAEFQHVLTYDESRWGRGRNPRWNNYWKMHFDRYGVKVVLVHTSSSSGDDIGSYVMEVVESAEASEYSKKLSRATLRGAIDNARRGFSCGGSAPFGYNRVAVDKVTGKKLRILLQGEQIREREEKTVWDLGDPLEVETVRKIFDLRIKGLGYVAIADQLNRDGIPPPKRGRWRNKDQKWSGGTIKVILENPAYCGCRVFNRHPQSHLSGPSKERWLNEEKDWIVVENAHPAIISNETFQLANRNRKEYTPRKNRHFLQSPYLLSGLIKCLHCGFNFQGQRYGRKNILYYVCGGYVNKGKTVCTLLKINAKELQTFIIKAIKTRILRSDLLQRVEESLTKRLKGTSVERLHVLEQLKRSFAEANIKMDRLMTLVENGVDLSTVIDRVREVEREGKQLAQKIKEVEEANLSQEDIIDGKAQVQHLMDNFEKILTSAPIHVQKELLRKFIEVIQVDRQSNTILIYLKKVPSVKEGLNTIPIRSDFQGENSKTSSSPYVVVEKKLKEKASTTQRSQNRNLEASVKVSEQV
jgi:site-specific DNA recombinase